MFAPQGQNRAPQALEIGWVGKYNGILWQGRGLVRAPRRGYNQKKALPLIYKYGGGWICAPRLKHGFVPKLLQMREHFKIKTKTKLKNQMYKRKLTTLEFLYIKYYIRAKKLLITLLIACTYAKDEAASI